ncbi:MAG: hypothetical protein JRH15_21475 [Deltaproteobacteria bacterium]|nr:hypothetical protein [Deltaproteobacteria bacterium]
MEIPFTFEPLLAFGAMGIFLVIGVFLRAKVSFFQSFLLPSCLIGGALGCILINMRVVKLPFSLFENYAFHLLNIAFISAGLTRDENSQNGMWKAKEVFRGAFWFALIKGVTWPLQALIGLLFVLAFGLVGVELFPTFGLLMPVGFNEGPGQALAIGKVYEGAGFGFAPTIGLTFAFAGYLFCFFLGMPLVKWGLNKRSAADGRNSMSEDFLKGILPKEKGDKVAGKLTMHSENIDTLAFQLAIIGVVYILTYFELSGLCRALSPELGKMIWGFFFGFGMVNGFFISRVLGKVRIGYLIDSGLQRRITGFSLDFMIVATLMAIQIGVFWKYFLPILFIAITGGLMTLSVIVFFGRRLYGGNLERTLIAYGMYTGQMSTGLLLLRMVDPDFKSQQLAELGIYNFLSPIFTFSCMIIAVGQISWQWSIGLTMLLYGSIMLVSLVVLRIFYWKEPQAIFK